MFFANFTGENYKSDGKEMEKACTIGQSDMKNFTSCWESNLPAWLIVYCLKGEAELTIQFKPHAFRQGMVAIIPLDMFPAFTSETVDFTTFYSLMDRDFAEKTFYGIPSSFYDAIYAEPILYIGDGMGVWMNLLKAIYEDECNPYQQTIISNILQAFALDFYSKWKLQYDGLNIKDERHSAETICRKFYNLAFDHFLEHRDIAFYADKLCITSCYLAKIIRQVCHETPKQALDRLVTLEMKYMLRNTTMTVEQIANHLHFSDTSYMCRYFRRQTGLSLSEYRKGTSDT